jgi:hypothetical protein
VQDEQFHGSVKYTLSLLLALFFMPLYLILAFAIVSPWWLAVAIFISIPFSGLAAWSYYTLFRRISGGLRIRNYIKNRNEEYITLRENFDKLLSMISQL